ncbi:hypothetical protein WDW86_08800 [Bdellovibrionota bacterium FG-2]
MGKILFFVFVLLATLSPFSARAGGLWKATESWNWDWEKRYATWVDTELTADFFFRFGIPTDCADAGLAARWIFSRINHLPAGNHLAGADKLLTHQSMRREWMSLPTSENWAEDKRFRAALDYLLLYTDSHSVFRDTYPVAITPEALAPGTLQLEISEHSGHTYIVRHLDLTPKAEVPIGLMNSTVPRKVRILAETGFWRMDQPTEEEGGFRRFLWIKEIEHGQWAQLAPEEMPYFSREQFEPFFVAGFFSFADAVIVRINPTYDRVKRLIGGIESLKTQLIMRMRLIENGIQVCQTNPCTPQSANYYYWSTDHRDAQIGAVFEQLEALYQELAPFHSELAANWENEMNQVFLVPLPSLPFSLKELARRWKTHQYSSDPRDTEEARWGGPVTELALEISALRSHTQAS